MKVKNKLEDMTIKDIKLYKENAEYDVRSSIKEMFDKYPFISVLEIGTLYIKKEDVANLHIQSIMNIEL